MTMRKLTDAHDLKALAHPLRFELLGHLVLHGQATATELAAALGESPSNCSWHLRKLAEHSYVEEVEGSHGRSRPWRATSTGLSWDDEEDSEAGAAGRRLSEVLIDREVERLLASRASVDRQPEEWRRAGSVTQSAAWITAEEARELSAKLEELLLSYSERIERPDLRPDGARLVSLVGWVAPRPEASEVTA